MKECDYKVFKKKNKQQNDIKLITKDNIKSHVSEAYRVLRTNIKFASVGTDVKKILITSSNPLEGKTTTVSNLAIVMAQAGSKVLVIDGDLRKPNIATYFEAKKEKGLTNLLTDKEYSSSYIQTTKIPNIAVLTSGPIPPNPSELLGSERMKEILRSLSEKFDIVLVDTPPVGIVTDAAILSTICDGTLFVCDSRSTKIEDAKIALEKLKKVGTNILGVVLNKVEKNKKSNHYYYQEAK